jgi:hypothetical protein
VVGTTCLVSSTWELSALLVALRDQLVLVPSVLPIQEVVTLSPSQTVVLVLLRLAVIQQALVRSYLGKLLSELICGMGHLAPAAFDVLRYSS